MTPLEELRRWLRRGSAAEKVPALIAAVIALALVAWAVLPTALSSHSTQNVAAGPAVAPGTAAAATDAAATPTATGATAGAPSVASAAAPAAGTGASAASGSTATPTASASAAPGAKPGSAGNARRGTAASATPACPTANAEGVTDSTITIAVTSPDLGALNTALNIPTVQQEMQMNEAYAKWVNDHGGVGCRKIVVKEYADNPLDSNSEHALCLQILQDKPFANQGGLYSTDNQDCLPSHHIPSWGLTGTGTERLSKFYPYLFAPYVDSVQGFRDYVHGAKQLNWFDGIKKLGVITGDCFPEYWPELQGPLAEAGFPKNQIDVYDIGCPASVDAAQGPFQQAVLQFKSDGVSHVMSAGVGLQQFATLANKQLYYPKYATSDVDNTLFTSEGQASPDPKSFDGAIAITGSQYGGYNSKLDPGQATHDCDTIMQTYGAPPTEQYDAYSGTVCNNWGLMVESLRKLTSITAEGIAPALDTLGVRLMSYPGGKANFNRPKVTYVAGFWRPAHFDGSGCKCWLITDPNWHDSQ